MNDTNINEPAWSDRANEQGLQAWRDAEAALVARRSPAERAAQPLDSEREHLAELTAGVEVAVVNRERAVAALYAVLPRAGNDEPGSAATIAAARGAYARADDLERIARGVETDYRAAMSRAGQARALKITTKESAR